MARSATNLFRPGETDRTDAREAPTVWLKEETKNRVNVEISGDFGRLSAAVEHNDILSGLLSQMATLGSNGKHVDEGATKFAISFVDSMAPRDATEALLCTQMAAIHQATMTFAGRLNHVENIPQQDSAERALNKLARTFAGQMDTLKRYRSKGQQTVRVERVTVQDGGQAIVGSVEAGGRGRDET